MKTSKIPHWGKMFAKFTFFSKMSVETSNLGWRKMPNLVTMKLLGLLTLTVAAAMIGTVWADEENRFENVNIDEILASKRLIKNYINCLLDKGSCPPEARELKKQLPNTLQSECNKCTESQKKKADKFIKHVRANYQEDWEELKAKYDPDHIYESKIVLS
ncbi:ejaculatory bulb-specific protein 3 [Stomoxys calcitrans]|uniref:ejaculatory bulb-specific protein 3 n=1 Tax=Stomoxys calcitrans TaxID=35570 RepID=UPI0027E22378|nr:ejaculatory bulb-specific protein 3 [Stomoxys calcitrans]